MREECHRAGRQAGSTDGNKQVLGRGGEKRGLGRGGRNVTGSGGQHTGTAGTAVWVLGGGGAEEAKSDANADSQHPPRPGPQHIVGVSLPLPPSSHTHNHPPNTLTAPLSSRKCRAAERARRRDISATCRQRLAVCRLSSARLPLVRPCTLPAKQQQTTTTSSSSQEGRGADRGLLLLLCAGGGSFMLAAAAACCTTQGQEPPGIRVGLLLLLLLQDCGFSPRGWWSKGPCRVTCSTCRRGCVG